MNPWLNINWDDPTQSLDDGLSTLTDCFSICSTALYQELDVHYKELGAEPHLESDADFEWFAELGAEWLSQEGRLTQTHPNILRSSIIVQSCVFFERWLNELCIHLHQRLRLPKQISQSRTSGWAWKRYFDFIETTAGFPIDISTSGLVKIKRAYILRNALIHLNVQNGQDARKAIRYFSSKCLISYTQCDGLLLDDRMIPEILGTLREAGHTILSRGAPVVATHDASATSSAPVFSFPRNSSLE